MEVDHNIEKHEYFSIVPLDQINKKADDFILLIGHNEFIEFKPMKDVLSVLNVEI